MQRSGSHWRFPGAPMNIAQAGAGALPASIAFLAGPHQCPRAVSPHTPGMRAAAWPLCSAHLQTPRPSPLNKDTTASPSTQLPVPAPCYRGYSHGRNGSHRFLKSFGKLGPPRGPILPSCPQHVPGRRAEPCRGWQHRGWRRSVALPSSAPAAEPTAAVLSSPTTRREKTKTNKKICREIGKIQRPWSTPTAKE